MNVLALLNQHPPIFIYQHLLCKNHYSSLLVVKLKNFCFKITFGKIPISDYIIFFFSNSWYLVVFNNCSINYRLSVIKKKQKLMISLLTVIKGNILAK